MKLLKTTQYECTYDGSCFQKCGGRDGEKGFCAASPAFRQACKKYVCHTTIRKIVVFGITTVARNEDRVKCKRVQARYVAAVSSKKEFADLLDCSVYFVTTYACITGNEKEVKKAMATPHKLIFIESR